MQCLKTNVARPSGYSLVCACKALLFPLLLKGFPVFSTSIFIEQAGKASMVFIAPDIFSSSPQSEDHSNVLMALALQNFFPKVQFRLMAVEVDHLKLANNVGLNMYNCYAIDGLKSAIMATSLRCPGFAALVLNLSLPPILAPKAFDEQVMCGCVSGANPGHIISVFTFDEACAALRY